MKKYLFLFVFFFGCTTQPPEIKVDVLNDQEIILNGIGYPMNQFREELMLVNDEIISKFHQKYYIVLRVHAGVELETLQEIKTGLWRVKDNIIEIRYSYENSTEKLVK